LKTVNKVFQKYLVFKVERPNPLFRCRVKSTRLFGINSLDINQSVGESWLFSSSCSVHYMLCLDFNPTRFFL